MKGNRYAWKGGFLPKLKAEIAAEIRSKQSRFQKVLFAN